MEIIKDKQLSKFDHRELNKDLEIFFFDENIGQGLPVLLKNGTIIKNLIQGFIREKEAEYECQEVISPVLADPSLYQKSGHLSHYKDYIFPTIEKENERFQLRPMTCPHHCMIYKRKIHSYRDLPVWLCEHSILHRFESSGSLKGLERVRWMELSDNHVFVSEDQLKDMFKKCFSFVSEVFNKFKIKVDRFVCSLHDKDNVKYHDDEQLWIKSENSLISALEELQIDFVKIKGEAAFYGPKLDMEVKAIDGKNITFATIQFDFLLPKKFDLSYINSQGNQEFPIIIHYSSIGSYQRFISILLEQNQGKLPFWLSPVQLVLMPLTDNQKDIKVLKFCEDLKSELKPKIRLEIWDDKRLNYRIRKIHKLNIPAYIVIGEKEIDGEDFTLSYEYDSKKVKLNRNKLIDKLNEMNSEI
ncbi:MAG: Threonine--tRNA ligase 1 [Mycoplasmataceae bacterium]|nr:MAG: Threonine--tRNA ligase 1 [Mycoplasmataceae bacterium]